MAERLGIEMIYASMFALQALAEPCEGNNLKLIATQDNAAICMERHPAKGAPVLLVHGISANRHFWNLDSEHLTKLFARHVYSNTIPSNIMEYASAVRMYQQRYNKHPDGPV